MTNYLVTPWALAGRNISIWRWVQHPEVKSGSFWFLSPHYLPKNKAPRTPKRKTQSKGRCNVDRFSSHHDLSDITNIIIIHTGHFHLLSSIIKVIEGSSQWPNQPGGAIPPKPKCCITQHPFASMLPSPGPAMFADFSGSTREFFIQSFFDPDGIALPLFYCYHSLE